MNAAATSTIRVLEIAFTGYPVTNIHRAREFYENVLHLKPSQVFGDGDGQWIEYDIGAGTLAIANRGEGWEPSSKGPAVALEVEDFDAAVAALRAAGTKFALDPLNGAICRMAIIQDPDGNCIAIHRRHTH